MKKVILLTVLLFGVVYVKAQYVSLNDAEIQVLKKNIAGSDDVKKAFERYKRTAEQALNEQPSPIETIVSQGVLAGNPAKTASLKSLQDGNKIYALALCYRLYQQKSYLQKVQDFLLAWANTNKPNGDPINETKLEDMITGYDLIRNNVSAESKQQIDSWLIKVGEAEFNSASAKPGRTTSFNNWNSHRIKTLTLVAFTLHNTGYEPRIYQEIEKQINVNLNADGSGFDFLERDALHYHTYTLEPLLRASMVIYRATGKNYFSYQSEKGASIQKSVDFLVPFVTGVKTHGEFVNSKVPFDKQRAANHEKGYEAGTLFEPGNGVYTLSLAAYFNPAYIQDIQQVNTTKQKFNWQLALDQVMKPVTNN
ncbi:Alginate lyase [Mucilaginibacter lappiensis]|uniref:Alginate lyase domain-containing protein n=1 Tax=Mucilaginibacter lappiensis TaxID=354630 RepID=A0ABR6PCC8_9SPHI|nr:alginate lyase family protein [Mucilaginibacter lappiensis]MBB6107405.1 hypothetical protein [Mucilaginibacter lappiensis]SIQ09706.1 Alginate lyase [Mucilaginibacter lappiensis]